MLRFLLDTSLPFKPGPDSLYPSIHRFVLCILILSAFSRILDSSPSCRSFQLVYLILPPLRLFCAWSSCSPLGPAPSPRPLLSSPFFSSSSPLLSLLSPAPLPSSSLLSPPLFSAHSQKPKPRKVKTKSAECIHTPMQHLLLSVFPFFPFSHSCCPSVCLSLRCLWLRYPPGSSSTLPPTLSSSRGRSIGSGAGQRIREAGREAVLAAYCFCNGCGVI